jgi:hypothetical protein
MVGRMVVIAENEMILCGIFRGAFWIVCRMVWICEDFHNLMTRCTEKVVLNVCKSEKRSGRRVFVSCSGSNHGGMLRYTWSKMLGRRFRLDLPEAPRGVGVHI